MPSSSQSVITVHSTTHIRPEASQSPESWGIILNPNYEPNVPAAIPVEERRLERGIGDGALARRSPATTRVMGLKEAGAPPPAAPRPPVWPPLPRHAAD